MKLITLFFSICFLTITFATDEAFITTKVFKYSSKNGTPVFTDKEPKNGSHEIKTIKAAKSTGDGNPITVFKDTAIYYPKKRHKSSNRSAKNKKKQLAKCKKYKERFEAVSEKMRIGYKASQYRALEKKRVKYRDLLFYQCDSHELL